MNNNQLGHGSKSALVINTFAFGEFLGDKTSFVALNCAVGVIFDLKNPFAADGTLTKRQRNHRPCVIVFKGLNLRIHDLNPSGVMMGLLIRASSRRREILWIND